MYIPSLPSLQNHFILTKLQYFFRIPAFPAILGTLVKALMFTLPLSAIYWVARKLGNAPHVAQGFAEFVKGPHAVRQTMHLLRDSGREIKEDKWTEKVWGSAENEAVPLKLYFAEKVNFDRFLIHGLRTDVCRMDGYQVLLGIR